ncbi:DEAD/DEAH box helicase [Amycolatopsis pigmentata]|uniref:DEAD/DEAH box helicase n=1 Tax=Amycolatopsis pigmentata TaxID=450801 RepID=A0ABW5GA34_9PSEU
MAGLIALSKALHFGLLHPRVQQWVWQRGWSTLHDIQDALIPAVLDGGTDVLVAAATPAGRTAAAFLPICSELAEPAGPGVRALYIGPLEALINDRFHRVDELCEALEIPAHRWHGDVSGTREQAVPRAPSGILLITPESLEAMFVLWGKRIRSIFAALRYVVIDELHSFLGTERGSQLLSQLHRLETTLKRRVPRIGLSATLGNMSVRPDDGDRVTVLKSRAIGQDLRLRLRSSIDDKAGRIGPPPSVAALRQRLECSGSRDEPAVLRVGCSAVRSDAQTPPLDRLHLPLVQTIASIELLFQRWCEPPEPARLHLSALIQQLLSLVAQHGGVHPVEAYRVLCGQGSPFSSVTAEQFAELLRVLSSQDVLTQAGDGDLSLGGHGEATVNDHGFFAAFQAPEEYRVVHPEVRRRMRAFLEDDHTPGYADAQTRVLVEQARRAYAAFRLDEAPLLADGADTLLFPWTGDRQLNTLAVILCATGMNASADGAALRIVGTTRPEALTAVDAVACGPVPEPGEIARKVKNKATRKFDNWLSEDLLCEQYASTSLDCAGAVEAARILVREVHI